MPGKTIYGRAIVFDRWSLDLGGFVERISAQAIDRTLREGHDLRALWSHQPDQLLARMQGSGTLRIAKDRHGLVTEIDLPSSRSDIAELVERRDVSGMSFGFMTVADAWEDGPLPKRTILDMLVREVSPVAWPAYPQTSVAIAGPAVVPSLRSARNPRGAAAPLEVRSMEYAMERDERGEKVAHSAARASLERFLAAKAERGEGSMVHCVAMPMIYRSVYRDGRWEGEWVPRGSVVEGMLKYAEARARGW
jgi:HK97 family phage prohead protease